MGRVVNRQVNRMRKRNLIALIKEEEIRLPGATSMGVKALRKVVRNHFNNVDIPTTNTIQIFPKTTNKQLVKLSEMLHWKDDIIGGSFGWQLKAIEVCACKPSTYDEMLRDSKRLTSILNPTLKHTNTPRLHYAKKGGGVDSRFMQGKGMYPGRFGERTKLGPEYVLKCSVHNIQYNRCSLKCKIGIFYHGKWLYEALKKGNKNAGTKSNRAETSTAQSRERVSDMASRLKEQMR